MLLSMARPIRIEFSGALYHVTARGDRREAIYEDDVDRRALLEVLGQVVGDFNWIGHAYCLMTNHYSSMACRRGTAIVATGERGTCSRAARGPFWSMATPTCWS